MSTMKKKEETKKETLTQAERVGQTVLLLMGGAVLGYIYLWIVWLA